MLLATKKSKFIVLDKREQYITTYMKICDAHFSNHKLLANTINLVCVKYRSVVKYGQAYATPIPAAD